MSDITEEMIQAGALALRSPSHYDGPSAPRLMEILSRQAKLVLEAALAGRTVVDLPALSHREEAAAEVERLADELGRKGTLGHESAEGNDTAAMVATTELSTAARIRRRAAELRDLDPGAAGDRVVVELPEPDRQDSTWASWGIRDGDDVIDQIEAARKSHNLPITHGAAGVRYSIEYAETLAGTLLAAAREARRLASGSSESGEPT